MLFSRFSRRLAVGAALLALAAAPAMAQIREQGPPPQGQSPLPGPLQPPVQPQQAPVPDQQPAPQPMPGDSALVRRMSVEDLMAIARDLGYTDIQQRSNNSISYRAFGQLFACFIERDGDLRLYWSIRKRGVPVQRVNDWNRDKRLSRAFIDKEGEPVLETDLLTDAGMTRAQVLATFRTFETSVRGFRRYIGIN